MFVLFLKTTKLIIYFLFLDGYVCTHSQCIGAPNITEHDDWGYYSGTNGNCSICRDACDNDTKCWGVECDDDHQLCLLWRKDACLPHKLPYRGSEELCLKRKEGD